MIEKIKTTLQKPWVIFFALSLIITLPLFLTSGFIFLLDAVTVPKNVFPINQIADSAFLLMLVRWFLRVLLPGGFVQKIMLTGMFFLAGFGMFRLVRIMRGADNSLWGAYFAGIFFIFNPYVYSRVISGQWGVVISYSLLPWLFVYLMRFLTKPSWRLAVWVALWLTLIAVADVHSGLLVLFLFHIAVLCGVVRKWFQSPHRCLTLVAWSLIADALFVLFNIYWIVPIFLGASPQANFVHDSITNSDIFSFFTRSDAVHGVIWNTAAMYGFWGDDDMRYVSGKYFVSYWFYLYFIVLAIAGWGAIQDFVRTMRSRRTKEETIVAGLWSLGGVYMVVGILSFILAIGIAYEPFKPFTLWLYDHVPYFRGFREPQKFVAMIVFVYAFFGACGVDDIIARVERLHEKKWVWLKLILPGLLLLVPLAYSPGLLWGFHGQIKPAQYPASWFEVDRLLSQDTAQFRTLFLPWHQYMYLKFAHTVVANPAAQFFNKPVIAGDNMEFGPIYTQSVRPESKYVEKVILANGQKFINKKGQGTMGLGDTLNGLNIKYVILNLDSDYFNYTFVDQSPDMELVYISVDLKVYFNKKFSTVRH